MILMMSNKKRKPPDRRQIERHGPKAENNVRRYYTMKTISRKALILITALVIALAVAGIRALDDYLDRTAWERAADVIYPMTNQRIEWTGAGSSWR
jgi:hypothetical protein